MERAKRGAIGRIRPLSASMVEIIDAAEGRLVCAAAHLLRRLERLAGLTRRAHRGSYHGIWKSKWPSTVAYGL
eukprot:719823-Prymnesium_polylepis.1